MKNQSRQKGLDFLCADSGLLNTREVIKHQMYLFLKNTNNTLMATDIVQVAATNGIVQHQEPCGRTTLIHIALTKK